MMNKFTGKTTLLLPSSSCSHNLIHSDFFAPVHTWPPAWCCSYFYPLFSPFFGLSTKFCIIGIASVHFLANLRLFLIVFRLIATVACRVAVRVAAISQLANCSATAKSSSRGVLNNVYSESSRLSSSPTPSPLPPLPPSSRSPQSPVIRIAFYTSYMLAPAFPSPTAGTDSDSQLMISRTIFCCSAPCHGAQIVRWITAERERCTAAWL